ncbi:ABC transporter ATP-binding protein [Blautia hydrogenotrophica]|uniref:ABC transporter ATP-binding protein n=2 Tax=Blautia hydrogenotrophica TaxID=53443 RepID=UPI003AB64F43
MELLKVENLTKKFKKKGILFPAVSQVSFTLEKGECLGIVGESGCGKSTTANMIARLQKEDEGEIYFEDRKISGGMLLKPVGKGLQMIFQNPQDSFDPRDSVIEGIMQGAAAYGIYSRKELTEKALELFSYVGLKEEYQNRKIRQLSGGECQRAAIARSLICEPKLLICDEATSALDVLVQAQIIDLLKRLKEEKGMSMLFITHDLPLAAAFCDRVAVMHQGRIIEIGASREVLKNPRQEETQKLLQAVLTI